jgi:Na+/H+ antiporter NhaD/arsenite permease-like protein
VSWIEFAKYGIAMTLIPLALMLAWMKILGS